MKEFHVARGHLHAHLEARMRQRGVTLEEIKQTMAEGWEATDAKHGTLYYKLVEDKDIILLTVKAR